ncbi:MAG TPA: hypothetical protein DEA62_04400, partial [Coxiellaceae bacterium]|nr:hypothetical protein [Coxiellaceae bacterium]
MKGYSRVIKCVAAIILILIPALSLAQPFPSSPLWDMFQNLTFTPPSNDMSVAFLARMFGAVPGVAQLATGGTTILGTVFGVFNAAILALSGVFLSYTITKIVTETTMDGSAMGKGTTIWTAVRCALSTSLLVPQASGYSMINGIVMWVVIQGVGLADITWSSAMDYLKAGGTTYAMPTSRVDYSLINWDVKTGNTNIDKSNLPVSVGSTDVLRSLVCAYSVHGALVKSQSITYQNLMDRQAKGIALTLPEQTQLANASKTIPEKGEVFSVYKKFESKCVPATVCTNPDPKKLPKCCPNCCSDYTGGAFQFPYVKDEAANPLKGYGLNIRDSSIPVLTGVCGTISYSIGQKDSKELVDVYTERGNRYIPAKLRGLEDMIGTLEPTAKNLIDQIRAVVPPPPVNKTQPNPDTYVIYNDGSDKGFFIKPNAAISTKYALGSDKSGGNLTVYVTFPKIAYDYLPAINWPLGSDEILSAAAAYQVALADAQTIGRNISTENASKGFSDAKKNGWIGAGSYYRLLATIQNSAKMEYNNYRLTGYVGLDQPFANPSDAVNRGNIPWYMVLFSAATPLAPGRPTPIAAIDSSYQQTMSNALTWIFLSYPYSVLHGKALAYSLSKTATTSNIGALAPDLGGISEDWIRAKLIGGA